MLTYLYKNSSGLNAQTFQIMRNKTNNTNQQIKHLPAIIFMRCCTSVKKGWYV